MDRKDQSNTDDMSMEDILSSIRKYVSENGADSDPSKNESDDEEQGSENVISLGEGDVIVESRVVEAEFETPMDEVSSTAKSCEDIKCENYHGPFSQLTNALKSYGKKESASEVEKQQYIKKAAPTADELFTSIAEPLIKKWIDENLRKLSEEMVLREIEKIKSE